ncbi:hypothetical protein OEA41_000819 [Lepraria neglecta]|uniref:Uncharacterized protein n=1 Tax=Lepraria neglecta TaxID=209136 RepID=A0AAD9ZJ43_9LECA|nr:hypothetical protein OEA41_000819 [Lepraria neglecta]
MQGESAIMQDMYWPSIFYEPRNANPLDYDGSAVSDLTPINENFMKHTSSLPSPGISDSYIRTEDHATSDRLAASPASAVRKLASLNVALYECAAQLPSTAKVGVSSAGIAGNSVRGSRKATLFAVDELFRLTTEFIDVMKCLSIVECETSATLSSMDPKQPGARSTESLVPYSQRLSHAGQPVTRTVMGPPSGSFSHMDEATMFMVVSYHCCLTEIYVSIFQMMQGCIEYSLAPQIDKDWAIILPQLQIGSIASPPVHVDINTPLSSATASMYMLMLTMLSSQLWEQLADVMRAGGDVPTGSASASRCALADTMWDTVTGRTDRLSQTIDATKHLLQRCSGVVQ